MEIFLYTSLNAIECIPQASEYTRASLRELHSALNDQYREGIARAFGLV